MNSSLQEEAEKMTAKKTCKYIIKPQLDLYIRQNSPICQTFFKNA